MSKTTRKFKPGEYWNIAQYESWFSDMAQQGLHLKKVGTTFAHFSKGEPKQMNYRIDLAPSKILPIHKETYAQKGWKYVTSYSRASWNDECLQFNVYSSSAEKYVPELNDDLSEQACQLKSYCRYLINQLIIYAIVFILYILTLFINNKPYIFLLDTASIPVMIVLVMYLFEGWSKLKGILKIHSLKSSLSNGSAMEHSVSWKKERNMNAVSFYLKFILIICILASIAVLLFISKERTLPAENNELPIVRLSDIEQNSNLIRVSHYESGKSYDCNNNYTIGWSLFAPVQYESREYGTIPDYGYGEYTVYTTVYQTTIPSVNEKVLHDLIAKYVYKFERQNLEEIHSPDFDKLFIINTNNSCEVFAAKGKGILYVRYHGNADTDTVIAAVLQKINKIA